ncbi:MAG: gliding motility-associated C-terminal domain-containing protein [Bacteroidetes bacterium]|nr:gliding motility-associated C-terminal domain-containing protein [Bacteroidota bacterium]
MKRFIFIFSITLFISILGNGKIQGQNLVPNPGFEQFSSCPVFASQLNLASPWFNPTLGTPEFFHGCADISSGVSVPYQFTGGYQPARSGVGYIGVYVYRTDIPNMREYAEIELSDPLKAGTCYYFEMFVNQPNEHPLVSDGIGALFVAGELRVNTTVVLPQLPQIVNPSGNIITDTAGWTKVSGYFTALGGEDHLVIGNFRDDAHTQHQVFNPGVWYTNSAYLLIDDVLLEESPLSLNIGIDTTLCRGQEILLSAASTGSSWFWNDGTTGPVNLVTHEGVYWVEATLGGCRVRDSIRIGYLETPPVHLPSDTALCQGEEILLDVFTWDAGYRWSDNSFNSYFLVSEPGTYSVYVYNRCGGNTDSVKVDYKDCHCEITVPNVFTPNDDGINDAFVPLIDCRLEQYSMTVFNRWGAIVFQTEDPGEVWDGTVHQTRAAEGTYFWSLSYTGRDNGKCTSLAQHGALTLIR